MTWGIKDAKRGLGKEECSERDSILLAGNKRDAQQDRQEPVAAPSPPKNGRTSRKQKAKRGKKRGNGGRLTPDLHRDLAPQHRLQLADLVLVLPQQRVLRVLVDLRFVADVLRAVRVPQRAQRLIVAVICRREAGDHQRLRVAAERILQVAVTVIIFFLMNICIFYLLSIYIFYIYFYFIFIYIIIFFFYFFLFKLLLLFLFL